MADEAKDFSQANPMPSTQLAADTAVEVTTAERTKAAEKAFDSGDKDASKAVHDASLAKGEHLAANFAPEIHGGVGSDFIKSIVFGGLDGVITTFSTIASVAGGALPIATVLVLGFANLIADGISMGVGDYLSSHAEFTYLSTEMSRTESDFEADAAAVRSKVAAALVEKGFSNEDAAELVAILGAPQHKEFFVEYVMSEHKGQEIPGDPMGPAKDGAVTFLSFLLFGSLPLWVYVITYGVGYHDSNGSLGISAAATVCSLALLGYLQGYITKAHRGKSAGYMTFTGSLACAAAYLLSWGISSAIGNGTKC